MRKFLIYPIILLLLFGGLLAFQTGSDPIVKFDGAIRKQIIDTIKDSTETIDIAMYRFTDPDVIKALKLVKDKVRVRVILNYNSDYESFKGQGFKENEEIGHLGGRNKGTSAYMHNKFGIFDDKLVMTGSYNISDNAHKNSYENAIFLRNRKVIDEYQAKFEKLWKEALNNSRDK